MNVGCSPVKAPYIHRRPPCSSLIEQSRASGALRMPNARRAATVRLVAALEAASAGRAIVSPTARRERSFHIHRPRCRRDPCLAITTFGIWQAAPPHFEAGTDPLAPAGRPAL